MVTKQSESAMEEETEVEYEMDETDVAIDHAESKMMDIDGQRIADLEDTLKDLIYGAEMMLQPSMRLSGAFLRYVEEVKRVAKEGLHL
jgi:hypothetical protein